MGSKRVRNFAPNWLYVHNFGIIHFVLFYRRGESVTLKGHTGAVRSVNFSQDSRHLVTASDDKTAKVKASDYVLTLHQGLCELIPRISVIVYRFGACRPESSHALLWDIVTGSELHVSMETHPWWPQARTINS